MEILVIGNKEQAAECTLKFGTSHVIRHALHADDTADTLKEPSVVFDFDTPQNQSRISGYKNASVSAVFFDSSIVRLETVLKQMGELKFPVFGFCGLRTFVNRELLEVTTGNESYRVVLASTCAGLGTSFQCVADQAGMVTPRVICMIINEAYYTLEEGTASREDIDLAMKLGTNYPWGPFEWGERIGLGNVMRVLEASRNETGDARYEVCPLLKRSVLS